MKSASYGIESFPVSNLVSSVTQLCPTLWPHELQHAKLPSPSLFPAVCSNSCPLSQWCHPTISSSAYPFSPCPQSFPVSRSFPRRWLFTLGGQSIALQLQHKSFQQGWFPLGRLVWSPWAVQRTLKSFPQHHSSKASILQHSAFFMVQLSYLYMTTGKTIALIICVLQNHCGQRLQPWN